MKVIKPNLKIQTLKPVGRSFHRLLISFCFFLLLLSTNLYNGGNDPSLDIDKGKEHTTRTTEIVKVRGKKHEMNESPGRLQQHLL